MMYKKTCAPLSLVLFALAGLLGCGGGTGGNGGGGGGGNPQPTVTLSTTTPAITSGQSATLNIGSANATSAALTNFTGTVPLNGPVTVSPTVTTTYTATVTGPGGSATSSPVTITVNQPAPTVTSVVVTATPSSISLGQTSTCTAVVNGTNNPSQAVTWTASGGTITSGGVLTPTATGTAACIAHSTVTGYTNMTGSANVTVNLGTPTITGVSVSAHPSTIDTSQTSALTVNVTGTGGFDPTVKWSVSPSNAGTVSLLTNSTATFNPSSSISTSTPVTITATSNQDSTKSGSATVTVNVAVAMITSISPSSLYFDDAQVGFPSINIAGSGFVVGDLVAGTPPGIVYSVYGSDQNLNVLLNLDTPHISPGILQFSVCHPDGTDCSNQADVSLMDAGNKLALSTSGEWFFFDQAQGAADGQNGYVRKFKPDGTADGSFYVGSYHSIAVDDLTGHVLVDAIGYDENGNQNVPWIQFSTSGSIWANATKNGWGCFLQTASNLSYCYSTVGGNIQTTPQSIKVGSQPITMDMGLFGSETDALVFSRDGTPTVWKINVSGGDTTTSQAISGITPVAQLSSGVGGWVIKVFDSGPANGTVALLSSPDKLLTFLNETTLAVTKQVPLSGVPFNITKDTAHGTIIVAFLDAKNGLTTFAAINPTTGAVTNLTTTWNKLAVGLQVSTDGNNLIVCQRTECNAIPNK